MASLLATAASSSSEPRTKTKKRHFIGQKVKLFVAGEPVLNVLMWGVAHTVADLSALPAPLMLLPDDFKAHCKLRVDNHLFSREHLPAHFKFKEYCPVVFRDIRERFGLDDQDYASSLTRGAPTRSSSPPSSFSPSSSSSSPDNNNIFHSYDRRLVVKSVSAEDVSEIHNVLKRYHAFVVECHGRTLLPQFLGMYKLTLDGVDTFAVVTRNAFGRRRRVHRKYDLKGSTVAREASPRERAKPLPTLKDVDFLREERRLHLGEEAGGGGEGDGDDDKRHFLEKLRRDVDFLGSTLKVMDYRLLLGIHDVERGEREEEEEAVVGNARRARRTSDETAALGIEEDGGEDRTGGGGDGDVYALGSHGGAARREVYFMAIVGILTHYDARKKAAHAAKTVKHGDRHADISTVNPDTYAKRFLEFVTTIL